MNFPIHGILRWSMLILTGLGAAPVNKTCPEIYRVGPGGQCHLRIGFVPQEIWAYPVLDGQLESRHADSFEQEVQLYAEFVHRYPAGHVFTGSEVAGCPHGKLPCPVFGFDIDLMAKVLSEILDWSYDLVSYPTFPECLYAARSGSVDIAWMGAVITAQRESCYRCPTLPEGYTPTSVHSCCLDFTFPYFETGIALLVKSEHSTPTMIEALATARLLNVSLLFVVMLFVTGHVMWILESRTATGSQSFPKSYFQGVFEGIYWSCTTAATVGYGDKAPTTTLAKIYTMIWMFGGMVLTGLVTGVMSAALTARDIALAHDDNFSLHHMAGKRVCFVPGVYEEYMAKDGGSVRPVRAMTIAECMVHLNQGEVDAVLYDKPNLDLYVRLGRVKLDSFAVSQALFPSDYGLAFPEGSDLTHRISGILLSLIAERSYLNSLRETWAQGTAATSAVSDDYEISWKYVILSSLCVGWMVMVKLTKTVMTRFRCIYKFSGKWIERVLPRKCFHEASACPDPARVMDVQELGQSGQSSSTRTPEFLLLEELVRELMGKVDGLQKRFDEHVLFNNLRL